MSKLWAYTVYIYIFIYSCLKWKYLCINENKFDNVQCKQQINQEVQEGRGLDELVALT